MGKKRKKTALQKFLKKCRKFVINGKPMSQVVHWTIIFSIAGLYGAKMADAAVILNNIGN